MDNFREWLSDNLRYILLGFFIIVILLVMFFGIRFLSSHFGGEQTKENNVTEEQQDNSEEDNDKEANQTPEEETTPEPTVEAAAEDPLEKNAYPTVNALMQNYYTALGNRDVQTLKTFVDQLDPTEESAIANSRYIEGYSSIEAYTKKGLTDTSYVVLVCYGHKYVGYETVLPGVSCMYVDTKEDGSLYIVAEPTQEQQDHITEVTNEQDVQELLSDKQQEYDEALASDEELSTYLSELGVEGSAAMEAETGATITAKSNCNVREQASADSDKVGELVAGQQVTKTGEEDDWIKIEFDGQEGYVRGDLFQ
ncbi:MAG: SH3 domain-containing protein [Clostridia bacterium]|nr:SH3 domain-containing protein [Clostridia bacterium]NCC42923.1 SH3 domain-containing protein [Clostridia bacterium]